MFKHILLPIDGSELSAKATKDCIAFAKAIGAKLTAIHVVSHFHLTIPAGYGTAVVRKLEAEHEEESKMRAENLVAAVCRQAAAAGVDCNSVLIVGDSPYEEIIRNAKKQKCDLIMMASHGRRGLEGLLLGSETAKVLTHSKIPVLVVR